MGRLLQTMDAESMAGVILLVGEQTDKLPWEYCYRVALPGPDPLEFELTRRLYPDQEFPRFKEPLTNMLRTEQRCEVSFESMEDDGYGLVQLVAIPNRYTQAKRRRVLRRVTVGLGVLYGDRIVDVKRELLAEVVRHG